MTTATLALSSVQRKIQNKVDSIDIPMINWKSICYIGFVAWSVLLVFYVWQVNGLTRGSYLISNYENQISKLSDENKNLQISFAENSFMDEAMVKVQGLNFQKAVNVKYINIMEDSAKTSPENKNI